VADQGKDISFFVPCYNEEENVVPTMETIRVAMAERSWSSEILVYDDASVDRTAENVEAYQSAHLETEVRLFRNQRRRGPGANYLKGAFAARGRHYMMVSGDNDTPLASLQVLLAQIGRADMVIPYLENMQERPWLRRVLSKTFTRLVGWVSGSHLPYYNGMVIHRTETVRRFQPRTAGFAYQAEILCQAVANGLSYVEVPIRTVPQRGAFTTSALRLPNVISVVGSLGRMLWDPKYHRSGG